MIFDVTKLIRRSKPALAQATGKLAYHAHLNGFAEIVFAYSESEALALAKIEFGQGAEVFRSERYDGCAGKGWVAPRALLADGWTLVCEFCGAEITSEGAKAWQNLTLCGERCYSGGLDLLIQLEEFQRACHQKILSLIHAAEDVQERFGKILCGSGECYCERRNVVSTFKMPEYVFPVEYCHGCDTVIVQPVDKEKWAEYQRRM